MAFVKPSSVTSQTGAYEYRGGMSSASANYIDNSFPNLFNINAPNTINDTQTFTGTIIADGGNIVLENAQFIVTSESTNFVCDATYFTCTVPSGGDFICASGSLAVFSGNCTINGTLDIAATINMGVNQFLFADTVTSPSISQSTTTGNGANMAIVAQFTSTNGNSGGSLVLSSGGYTGASGTEGNVLLQCGENTMVTVSPTAMTVGNSLVAQSGINMSGGYLALNEQTFTQTGSPGGDLYVTNLGGVCVIRLNFTTLWDAAFTLVFPNQNSFYTVVLSYPSIGTGAVLKLQVASNLITAYTFSSNTTGDGTWVFTDGSSNIFSGWHNYTS